MDLRFGRRHAAEKWQRPPLAVLPLNWLNETFLSRKGTFGRGFKPIRWTTDACGRIGDNRMALRAECGKVFSNVTRLEV
ncbi:MAG: hypothetical protein ACTS4U_00600 [Candidatus Hodgkinia cicadicola]